MIADGVVAGNGSLGPGPGFQRAAHPPGLSVICPLRLCTIGWPTMLDPVGGPLFWKRTGSGRNILIPAKSPIRATLGFPIAAGPIRHFTQSFPFHSLLPRQKHLVAEN